MKLFIFLLAIIYTFPVAAQQGMLPSKPSIIDDLSRQEEQKQNNNYGSSIETYKDIPASYIDEAINFYEQCQIDIGFKQFYNCRCLSVKYLDARIASGPDRTRNSIILSLQRTCKDGTYAAGIEYQRCMNDGTLLFPKKKTIEEYCSCMANEYAKLYEVGSAVPGTKSFIQIRSSAHLRCQS